MDTSIVTIYPIKYIETDKEIPLLAANFKANYKISYEDAFAAGLAELKKAVLVTGDKEFKQLESRIKIMRI